MTKGVWNSGTTGFMKVVIRPKQMKNSPLCCPLNLFLANVAKQYRNRLRHFLSRAFVLRHLGLIDRNPFLGRDGTRWFLSRSADVHLERGIK